MQIFLAQDTNVLRYAVKVFFAYHNFLGRHFRGFSFTELFAGNVLCVFLWYCSSWLTNVKYRNPVYDDVYSIQHYVIKFVSDLPQVGGFLRVLRFPPPIKLTAMICIN